MPTTSLDEYMRSRRKCDSIVLKIDAEGAETKILEGARILLSGADVTILVEAIESLQQRQGASRSKLLHLLAELRFHMQEIDEHNLFAVRAKIRDKSA